MESIPWDMVGAFFGILSFILTIVVEWDKLTIRPRIIIGLIVGVAVFGIVKFISLLPIGSSITPASSLCPERPLTGEKFESIQAKTYSLVPGAKITWYDDFGCDQLDVGWNMVLIGKTSLESSGGKVKIRALAGGDHWDGISRTDWSLSDNQGILVLFRYTAGTVAPLFVETGTWKAQDYKGWGLEVNENTTDLVNTSFNGWYGTNYVNDTTSIQLTPGEWYYLLIKFGNNGTILTRIWERDNQNILTETAREMGANWEGLQWHFVIQVHEGAIEVDEYQEIEFGDY